METTNIYTLTDPETNQVRYIGKANNISQRYQAHLNKSRDHQTHKRNWVNSLRQKGLKPIIDVIDIVPIKEWIFWETYWVSQFKAWGFKLVNNTNGGDGCTFGNETSFKKGDGAKPIVALTKEGVFVKEFFCAKDGVAFCGKNCVDNALRRKLKSAGGYLWLYKLEYDNITDNELKEFVIWANTKKKIGYNSGCFRKGVISLNFGKKASHETKLKISKTRICKKVLQYDLNDVFIMEHRSIEDAAKHISGCTTPISAICNNKKHYKTYKKYKWKFKN